MYNYIKSIPKLGSRKEVLSLEKIIGYLILSAFCIFLIWGLVTNHKQRKKGAQAAASPAEAKTHRSISELLDHLEQHLGAPFPEFRVQSFEHYFDRLTYEAHDPGAIASVTDQVLRHYRLDPSKVKIESEFFDKRAEDGKAVRGQFQNEAAGHGKVRILLEPKDSEFDTVIAIIMHECAHYFSEIHHTKLEDTEENERLTDVTSIWLGGGERIARGYFPSSHIQIGYLTKKECQYAISETERRRQAAIASSEAFRQQFIAEAAAQTAVIDMAGRMLSIEALCGAENQEKLHILKTNCRHIQVQLTKILAQLEHAMSKDAYCEMNAGLLQTALTARESLDPVLGTFETFRPLTMDGLQIDKAAYAYHAAVCAHAQAGNIFSQFEMLQFYNAHPSAVASEEAKLLMEKLEGSDIADAHYLLGRCWMEGICVPADQNAAIRHWVQAAGLGSEQAEQALRELHQSQPQAQKDA